MFNKRSTITFIFYIGITIGITWGALKAEARSIVRAELKAEGCK